SLDRCTATKRVTKKRWSRPWKPGPAHGAGVNLRHRNDGGNNIAAVNAQCQTGINHGESAEAATESWREKPKHGKKS
ncbi:hypothetical protein, partial [Bacteroides acidifaciens]|uniref:hypothetical protein n=1 Tax=Bacteroides acidifaciens TaxID=85831 RepID=UPI0027149A77